MKTKFTQQKFRALAALLFAATPIWAQAQISFTQHPEGQNVRPGQDVTLHVETAGPVSEVSWLHDGLVVPGATGRTLTIPDFDPESDAGLYHSVIREGAASAPVTSEPALVVPSRGKVAGFPAERSFGPNPWCPLCPHPPIIDPLDVVKPGTTTTIDVGAAQGVALRFSPASVDALSVSTLDDKFTFSCDAQEGSQLRRRGHVTVLKSAAQGPLWQMQSSFEGITTPGSGQVVLLANGVAVGDVTGDGMVARCRFFPGAVSNVSKKFDWAPKLEGGKEGYSMQFSSLRPVQVNGVTYQCDEVQFLHTPARKATFKEFTVTKRCARDHVAPGETRPDLTIQRVAAKGNHIPQAILTKRSSMTLTGRQKKWVPANFRYVDTAHVPDPTAPYSPPLMGGPVGVGTDTSSALSLNFTKIEYEYRPAKEADTQVWNEVESAPAMGAEFACKYTLEGAKWGLNGLPPGTPYPPALSFSCDGVFPGASGPEVARFCDMQQVLAAPGSAHPVRLHVGFALADFTLEVYHQGQLTASYPCAGGPVINVPDWLKDLLVGLRPATTATGQHIKEAVLTARIGEPYPQPWACTIEVNGVVHQGDELVFVRENLPAPALPAPAITAISTCYHGGGGGGAGKVSMQDFHFTKHVVHGHGSGFAFTSPDSPGLRFSRGLPPDFDDGTTVFDPFGPQPMYLAVVPTPNGVAIKTKGTGAEANRIIPTPVPTGPGVPELAGLLLPAVPIKDHAINTQGTGAPKGRLMAPSHPSSSTGGPECVISYACDGCDSWEAELEPLMAPGTTLPAGSGFTLDAYGTVSLNGLPPGQPVLIGKLHGSVGAPTAAGQPVTLTPDFSSLSTTAHRVVVRDASGAVVASQEGTSGPACTLSRLPRRWGKLGGAVECFAGGDDNPFGVSIPGLGTVSGTSVEILAVSGPGGGPHVRSKTGFTCTFSGCDALAMGGVACKTSEAKNTLGSIARSSVTVSSDVVMTRIGGDPDFDLLSSAAEVLAPRDHASGLPTGRRMQPITPPSPGFVCECPVGSEITIDAGGAETGQFSLTRAGQTGPDCGVRCDVSFDWAGPAPVASSLNMDRSPTGACVLTPDFSAFGGGEIEVMSWSWGVSNSGTGTYSNAASGGRIATHGVPLTSPVWPGNIGACVAKTSSMNTCVMFVQFPAPCDLQLNGTTHEDVGLLAFVLRDNDSAGNYTGTIDVTVTADEFAKVSLQDFHFRIPPPPISLSRDATGSYFNVTGRHTAAFASSDLGYWEEMQEYDIVENADGSICHHARLNPDSPRAFFEAMGVWKGWDGTVKGSGR